MAASSAAARGGINKSLPVTLLTTGDLDEAPADEPVELFIISPLRVMIISIEPVELFMPKTNNHVWTAFWSAGGREKSTCLRERGFFRLFFLGM